MVLIWINRIASRRKKSTGFFYVPKPYTITSEKSLILFKNSISIYFLLNIW